MPKPVKTQQTGTFAYNRKARHDYFFLKTYTAGISLYGNEVKSIRAGGANLKEAYIKITKSGKCQLINTHISAYQRAPHLEYNPTRDRPLLLHKSEISSIAKELQAKGLTLIPIKLYNRRGLIKLEFALAKGKKSYDKKNTLKERDIKRDTDREMKRLKYHS